MATVPFDDRDRDVETDREGGRGRRPDPVEPDDPQPDDETQDLVRPIKTSNQ